MKSQIQTPHFNARPSLLHLINKKLNRIDQFCDRILSSKIVLRIDNSDVERNKICEMRIALPGNELFAKKDGKSFEEAFEHVLNAIEHQIVVWKTKDQKKHVDLEQVED